MMHVIDSTWVKIRFGDVVYYATDRRYYLGYSEEWLASHTLHCLQMAHYVVNVVTGKVLKNRSGPVE